MNTENFKGKWTEFKGEVRKAWGNLTGDELEQTKGDLTAIKGLIQQKYGESQTDIHQRLAEIADRYVEGVKDFLREKPETPPKEAH